MSLLLEMFTYPFLVRAFLVGILVSLCAALLGVSLVLKRYSMIGDGLSHVSFGALAVAVALGWAPLAFSIPVVILAACASPTAAASTPTPPSPSPPPPPWPSASSSPR
jgi:zinc transport system permease protein